MTVLKRYNSDFLTFCVFHVVCAYTDIFYNVSKHNQEGTRIEEVLGGGGEVHHLRPTMDMSSPMHAASIPRGPLALFVPHTAVCGLLAFVGVNQWCK